MSRKGIIEFSMKSGSLGLLTGMIVLCSYSCDQNNSSFEFVQTDQGVGLSEGEIPVLFYQREPRSLDGRYICNNYIHPLYSPGGHILTEEFPSSHPYHRGIFWAWHQVSINDRSAGNSWIMQNISHKVTDVQTSIRNNTARLELDVEWHSSLLENGEPFVREQSSIIVHPVAKGLRIIDFEIRLAGLVPGVKIGGADDEKGYGGFCFRMKLPEDLVFMSSEGPVVPANLQTESGAWMNFSGSFGNNGGKGGIVIICHRSTPNYPAPWILRQKSSMQNIVYPGRHKTEIPVDQPVVLRYRVVVYEGSGSEIDYHKLEAEYNQACQG